jgi:hypothetical protein
VIEDYLRTSGVPFAVLLTGWFAENLWKCVSVSSRNSFQTHSIITPHSIGSLSRTDTGYTIPIAKYGLEDTQAISWVAHDLGASAVALLHNYTDPSKGVLGGSFPVISFKCTYPQLAAAIASGAFLLATVYWFETDCELWLRSGKKEVTFTPLETAGLGEIDEMVRLSINTFLSVKLNPTGISICFKPKSACITIPLYPTPRLSPLV